MFCNNRICCSNDSVGVSVPLVTDVKNCAVELQLLYDFIRKMNDKEVIIGMHNGNLKIKGKNSVAEFAVREDIIYDESLIHLNVNDFKRLPETFATALNFTGFATDGTKEAYSRCVIHDGAMYALSNVRAARFFMGEEAKSLFDGMTFISPECIGFVNKMCPKRYYISDGYVHLYDDEMRITAREHVQTQTSRSTVRTKPLNCLRHRNSVFLLISIRCLTGAILSAEKTPRSRG